MWRSDRKIQVRVLTLLLSGHVVPGSLLTCKEGQPPSEPARTQCQCLEKGVDSSMEAVRTPKAERRLVGGGVWLCAHLRTELPGRLSYDCTLPTGNHFRHIYSRCPLLSGGGVGGRACAGVTVSWPDSGTIVGPLGQSYRRRRQDTEWASRSGYRIAFGLDLIKKTQIFLIILPATAEAGPAAGSLATGASC